MEEINFTVISFADLDGDRDLDLVGTILNDERQPQPVLFENTGDRNNPEWTLVDGAFDNGGPEAESIIMTADVNGDGLADILTNKICYINTTPNSVDTEILTPEVFALQTYPNPFNSSLKVSYNLNVPHVLHLKLYSINGTEVWSAPKTFMQAGLHQAVIDGRELASGVYLLKLETVDAATTAKVVLIR